MEAQVRIQDRDIRQEDVQALTADRQRAASAFYEWLGRKLSTVRMTQKLETYWQLDTAALEAEVRRTGVSKLTPAGRLLAEEHACELAVRRPLLAKIRQLGNPSCSPGLRPLRPHAQRGAAPAQHRPAA